LFHAPFEDLFPQLVGRFAEQLAETPAEIVPLEFLESRFVLPAGNGTRPALLGVTEPMAIEVGVLLTSVLSIGQAASAHEVAQHLDPI
jgi:hypothetical protein